MKLNSDDISLLNVVMAMVFVFGCTLIGDGGWGLNGGKIGLGIGFVVAAPALSFWFSFIRDL